MKRESLLAKRSGMRQDFVIEPVRLAGSEDGAKVAFKAFLNVVENAPAGSGVAVVFVGLRDLAVAVVNDRAKLERLLIREF